MAKFKVKWDITVAAESAEDAGYLAAMELFSSIGKDTLQLEVAAEGDNPNIVHASVPAVIVHATELYKRLNQIKEEFFDTGIIELEEFNAETQALLDKVNNSHDTPF